MPDLKSWGLGGYRRSSLAKRIREILNMGTEPPDSLGVSRFAVHSAGLPALLGYTPEDPKVSPFLTYHHQYDFNGADDVDLIDTWEQTQVGSGKELQLARSLGSIYGVFKPGIHAGNIVQYQERFFAYYAEAGQERDLHFRATIRLEHWEAGEGPPPKATIYIGFTPTSSDALTSRQYGMGFLYDPSTEHWSFVIENNVPGEEATLRWELPDDPYEGEPWHFETFGFRLKWPTGAASGQPPELMVFRELGLFPGSEVFERVESLPPEVQVLDQPLRLTMAAENFTDVGLPWSRGTYVYLRRLKEIVPRI